MVNNLVFRWPKPLFFMVLGAHGCFHVTNVTTANYGGIKLRSRRRLPESPGRVFQVSPPKGAARIGRCWKGLIGLGGPWSRSLRDRYKPRLPTQHGQPAKKTTFWGVTYLGVEPKIGGVLPPNHEF